MANKQLCTTCIHCNLNAGLIEEYDAKGNIHLRRERSHDSHECLRGLLEGNTLEQLVIECSEYLDLRKVTQEQAEVIMYKRECKSLLDQVINDVGMVIKSTQKLEEFCKESDSIVSDGCNVLVSGLQGSLSIIKTHLNIRS